EATGTDASEIAPAAIVVDTSDVHGPDVGAGATADAKSAGGPANETAASTPSALADARARAAIGVKLDSSNYTTIRTTAELDAWVAEAREAGVVSFRTETTSLDPMLAEPVGFAL